MTSLSVNINKIALLRNARGRDFPSVLDFARRCLDRGAHGITLHPRPDQRHARYSDVFALRTLCTERGVELNVEGNPTDDFLEVVLEARPDQCTLVPDEPGQITSDHGWEVGRHAVLLKGVLGDLKAKGIRTSLFVDYDIPDLERVVDVGADRVELYTEPYAEAHAAGEGVEDIVRAFAATAKRAQDLGLGVNAGHDLNLANLGAFLTIPDVLEVSIGHALVVEALDQGIDRVIEAYVHIVGASA